MKVIMYGKATSTQTLTLQEDGQNITIDPSDYMVNISGGSGAVFNANGSYTGGYGGARVTAKTSTSVTITSYGQMEYSYEIIRLR